MITLGLSVLLLLSTVVVPLILPLQSSSPQATICKIGTITNYIVCHQMKDKVTLAGAGGIAITVDNVTKTITFTDTGGINLNSIFCPTNYNIHTINVTSGIATCALNNSTGSGSATYDTMQNIGAGQYAFYAGNSTKTNFQFKTLILQGSLSGTNGSSTVTIKGTVYQNNTGANLGTHGIGVYNGTNSGVLQFLSFLAGNSNISITKNGTNVILTVVDTNTAQVTSAGVGTSLISSKDNATQTSLRSLINATGYFNWNHSTTTITPNFLFKINSKTCGAGSAITTLSNSSDSSCQAFGNATSLDNLGDVKITSPVNAHILKYDGSIWKNVLFQITTTTCAGGSYASSINNQTGAIGCGTAVTSINSTSGAMSIWAHDRAIQDSITSGVVKISTKPSVLIGNDSATQRMDSHFVIANAENNGISLSYVSKTANYTATQYDSVIAVDATAHNPIAITLPSASTYTNSTFIIKKIDYSLNVVKVIGTSSQTFDGFASYNMSAPMQSVAVISDGSNWKIIDQQQPTLADHFITNALIANRGWYSSALASFTPTAGAPTTSTLMVSWFPVAKTSKWDKIQLEVSTLVAGSTCRMAIYQDNGTGYPSYIITGSDVGTVSGASLGVKTNTFTNPITLLAGNYWLASQCSTATTIQLRAIPTTNTLNPFGEVGTMGSAGAGGTNYVATNTFGALPSKYPTAGASVGASAVAWIQVHRIG